MLLPYEPIVFIGSLLLCSFLLYELTVFLLENYALEINRKAKHVFEFGLGCKVFDKFNMFVKGEEIFNGSRCEYC